MQALFDGQTRVHMVTLIERRMQRRHHTVIVETHFETLLNPNSGLFAGHVVTLDLAMSAVFFIRHVNPDSHQP